MKKWWKSKLVWLGLTMVLAATADAIVNGLGWRDLVGAVMGALVSAIRLYTDTAIGSVQREPNETKGSTNT